MSFRWSHGVLLVLLAAAALRLVFLDAHPPGFFRDEADKGYTTYLLLEEGCDSTGRPYPLFVRSLRIATSALYQYIDIPFVALLGLNEYAVRLPAALAGCGAVLAVWLLAYRWWGMRAVFFVALFLAFSPWHVLLSRWANQSILLTLWIPLGVYAFDRFVDAERPNAKFLWGGLTSLAFALALYTYAPARLFVPLLLIGLVVLSFHSTGRWSWHVYPLCLIGLLTIPLAHHVLFESGESALRFRVISIFGASTVWEMMYLFVKNYLAHLSPGFLFFGGDSNPRHSIGFPGQIQIYLLPLILLGLWHCFRRRGRTERFLLLWFFLFPVAAACTVEGIPHALRSVFGLPVLQLMAVCGIQGLGEKPFSEWKPRNMRFARIGWGILTMGLIVLFLLVCFHPATYPARSALYWQYGYRDAVGWWMEHRDEFPHAVVTGQSGYPETFFLFYGNLDPDVWLETHEIPGVEFLSPGSTMRNRYRSGEKGTAYLIRPGELQGVLLTPLHVVYLPNDPNTAVWMWVGAGK